MEKGGREREREEKDNCVSDRALHYKLFFVKPLSKRLNNYNGTIITERRALESENGARELRLRERKYKRMKIKREGKKERVRERRNK